MQSVLPLNPLIWKKPKPPIRELTGGTLLFTVLCVYCDEQAQERKDN